MSRYLQAKSPLRSALLVGLVAFVSVGLAAAVTLGVGGVAEPARSAAQANPRVVPQQVDQTFYVLAYHWDYGLFTRDGSRLDTITVPQGTSLELYAVNAYAKEAINALPAPVAEAMRKVPVSAPQAILAAVHDPQPSVVEHGFLIDWYGVVQYLAADARQPSRVVFTADRPGEFEFVCGNYCGVGHPRMTPAKLVVQAAGPSTSKRAPGRGEQTAATGAALGERIFTGAAGKVALPCNICHAIGKDGAGPDLAGLATRAGQRVAGLSAREYLRQSVLEPGAYIVEKWAAAMPSFQGQMTDEELNALVEYLVTLK